MNNFLSTLQKSMKNSVMAFSTLLLASAVFLPNNALAASDDVDPYQSFSPEFQACVFDPDSGLYKATTVMPLSGEEIVFTSYQFINDKEIVEKVEESAREIHQNVLRGMAKSVRERFVKAVLGRSGAPSPGLRKRALRVSKGGA